jgi:hypothetical protein
MNRSFKSAMVAAVAATLLGLTAQLQAQPGPGGGGPGGGPGGGGGRNFDPAQMRQRMMDRYKEALDITSDDDWKVFEPRIQKVLEARREVQSGGMARMFGRGPGGGGPKGGGDQAGAGGRRGGFGGQPSQAAQDLQKAIDSKASADQIKAKLAAYREDHQQKQANLEKAQEDLKKLLSVKQEAAAVLVGLID